MKQYRHIVEGYVAKAEKHSCDIYSWYEVYGYHSHLQPPCDKQLGVYLSATDFVKLFEPIEEKYCCNWFRECVEKKVIRPNICHVGWWAWDKLNRHFTVCPFCKTKL